MFIPLIVFPDFFLQGTKNDGLGFYTGLLYVIGILSFAHWIYCLWFLSKFDRYSKSLIPLILLNGLYAPFYYYQVKIKKRPLMNGCQDPKPMVRNENQIEENDYAELTRTRLIEIIEMWSSSDEQLKYQEANPEINLTEELFAQWNDFHLSEGKLLSELFDFKQKVAVKHFDKLLNEIEYSLKGYYPKLMDFIGTPEWNAINALSIDTLKQVK
jgi:hypothetical protein